MIPFRVALMQTSLEGVKESHGGPGGGAHTLDCSCLQLCKPSEPGAAGGTERPVFFLLFQVPGASLVAQLVKNPIVMQETQVQVLAREDPLEGEMATHSCILAWRVPWTEEPGMGYSPWSHESQTEQLNHHCQHQGLEPSVAGQSHLREGIESGLILIILSLLILTPLPPPWSSYGFKVPSFFCLGCPYRWEGCVWDFMKCTSRIQRNSFTCVTWV